MADHADAIARQLVSQPYPGRWVAASVLIGAALMDLIDITIVNVALPTIQSDFGASGTQLQWVVSGYMLAFGSTLIVSGSFGATPSAASASSSSGSQPLGRRASPPGSPKTRAS